MTKLQEIAQAIEAKIVEHFSGTMGLGNDGAIAVARAAVEAMRVPNEAMEQAAMNASEPDIFHDWQAMIDAILTEQ